MATPLTIALFYKGTSTMMNCSITDFGAKVTDVLQTAKIQKAIDECFLAGGGTVRIPKGIFRTGGLRLRSNVTLYLEKGAILEGSQNPEDYMGFLSDQLEPIPQEEVERFQTEARSANPYSRWSNGLIRAIHAKNIAIIGEEFTWIDGMNCFDKQGEEFYRGPHPISFHFCENVTLRGYSIRRSGNWAHAIFTSKNITAENVTVFGGHDGFDIRSCDNVLVQNCYFDTGDDAVAGFDNHDVTIRDCLFGTSCFVFRFGGNNILIENCKSLDGGNFGFRGRLPEESKRRSYLTDGSVSHRTGACFMYYCDFRAKIRKPVENILIRNCEFGELETIFCQKWNEGYVWCCNRPLQQIKFDHCVFKCVSDPIYIHGSAEYPMLFEMENCDITVKSGCENMTFLDGIDFGTVKLTDVRIHGLAHPQIVKHTPGEVILVNCKNFQIVEDNNPGFRGPFRDQITDPIDGKKLVYGNAGEESPDPGIGS